MENYSDTDTFSYSIENTYAELMGYKYRLIELPDEQSEDLYYTIRDRMTTEEELKEFRSIIKERTIKMLRQRPTLD